MNGSDVNDRPGGGRFTGWQITTMVVAVVFVIVALPMTVLAATGSLVNITDPVTASYMARVNAKGGLSVTPRDATTGYQAKVTSGGRLLTDVTGSAAYAAPSTAFSVVVSGDQSLQTHIPSFTSGKLMITSLTFVQTNGSPSYAWIYRYGESGCTTQAGYFAYLAAQDKTTVNATFPTPLIVTQPCAVVHVGGYGVLTITGYRVP